MPAGANVKANAPRVQHGLDELFRQIEEYYSKKILTHGPSPLGVDWSCVPTQEMRFVQLIKIGLSDDPIKLNDIGCGYGALLAFLSKRRRAKTVDYLGVDISPAMVNHARKRWQKRPATAFQIASSGFRAADYSVASGIFNVKLTQPIALWEQMIAQTLDEMYATSRLGLAGALR